MRFKESMVLLLWTGAILVAVVPWDLQNHTHWAKVCWIPFVTPPVKTSDIVANLLLYLPWGFCFARRRAAPVRIGWVVAYAAALSIATEATQLFSHTRFPSATDVTCNVAGAWLGAVIAAVIRRQAIASGHGGAVCFAEFETHRQATSLPCNGEH
jgi:glycopeptide antibiotics resistance protein